MENYQKLEKIGEGELTMTLKVNECAVCSTAISESNVAHVMALLTLVSSLFLLCQAPMALCTRPATLPTRTASWP